MSAPAPPGARRTKAKVDTKRPRSGARESRPVGYDDRTDAGGEFTRGCAADRSGGWLDWRSRSAAAVVPRRRPPGGRSARPPPVHGARAPRERRPPRRRTATPPSSRPGRCGAASPSSRPGSTRRSPICSTRRRCSSTRATTPGRSPAPRRRRARRPARSRRTTTGRSRSCGSTGWTRRATRSSWRWRWRPTIRRRSRRPPTCRSISSRRRAIGRRWGWSTPGAEAVTSPRRDVEEVARLALLEGQALIDLGRAAEALRRIDAALVAQPHFGAAVYERGVALFELCRFDEARATFTKVLAETPDHAHALYHLGLIEERSGRRDGRRDATWPRRRPPIPSRSLRRRRSRSPTSRRGSSARSRRCRPIFVAISRASRCRPPISRIWRI